VTNFNDETTSSQVAIDQFLAKRIALTTSCNDCDTIPKVQNAGSFAADNSAVQIMHNGIRVERDGYDGKWMTEVITLLQGHHEPQEELVFHQVLERLKTDSTHPIMMELGSYWCYYSAWFLNNFPHGKAFCIEPNPENLALGKRNMDLNSFQATFFQATIGDQSIENVKFETSENGDSIQIPQESIPSLMSRFGLNSIDILHSDIQGAELPMLLGATDLIKKKAIRFLVISSHHGSISSDDFTHEKCLALIEDLGGHVIAEHNVFESYGGDGLIVASFDERDKDMLMKISKAKPWESLFSTYGNEVRQEVQSRRAEVLTLNAMLADLNAMLADKETASKDAHSHYLALNEKFETQLVNIRTLEIEAAERNKILENTSELNSSLMHDRQELELLKKTKLMRWSNFPRRIYRRLRRVI